MDGQAGERDDRGDTQMYYRFGYGSSVGGGEDERDGTRDHDSGPVGGAHARNGDQLPPEYPTWGEPYDDSNPYQAPYQPPGYSVSGYETTDSPPGYGRADQDQGGYGWGGYDPAGYGGLPSGPPPAAEEPPRHSPSRELAPTGSRRRSGDDTDAEDRPSLRRRAAQARRNMPLWQELPLLLVVAFCLAVLIRTFLLQAFFIPSSSMEQTLLVGDRVLVNKIVYDVRSPERGEVIVFRGTDNWAPENPPETGRGLMARIGGTLGDLVGVSRPGEKDFIKRVIGVPGDRVSCCDSAGRVYVNGMGLDEPYVLRNSPLDVAPNPRACGSRRFDEILVPPGQLFVMGDNRIVSQDSRCQGTVPIENVIGRAFVIVWPSGRWDTLGVPEIFARVPGPVAIGPAGNGPRAPDVGAAVVTLPILVSLVVSARSGRKPRWGRRTLRT